MSNDLRLIFLGPPGAGKGTQALLLAEQLEIPHISTGEILRSAIADDTPLGQQAQSYVDKGELVPDKLLASLIRQRLSLPDAQKGWVLDGFPRTVNQATFLDELLGELHQTYDYVVNFEVQDEVLIERLLTRGRRDDTEETIRRRIEVYRQETAPLLDFYRELDSFCSVDGNRKPEEVTESLKQVVRA
ncbi:MAG: adenylate kinase [Cyanobacteria bacterium SW_12_48_29]|jgi:adenylate kinase|nr:MAG: adenylate kinase [Cyanobacteria bacterium QH_2_48_84]PSO67331.1 MAG: adenylate kinase [Cyanobacteria bacterium QS_1_48_34]PSO90594.1 MAG: adenylate kinase [Cyanobacteria bacterium QS_9_48_30]PSP03754.1 MAG: adenylate kinase [Cyanobacteria bacterium SW_12_48_29]